MIFRAGNLVEYTGREGRHMSIAQEGKLIYETYAASANELMLFIHLWSFRGEPPGARMDIWGMFLAGDKFVVERLDCFRKIS